MGGEASTHAASEPPLHARRLGGSELNAGRHTSSESLLSAVACPLLTVMAPCHDASTARLAPRLVLA